MADSDAPEVYVPYSVRERNRTRQGQPVVYQYDELPRPLRVQIVQILDRTIGTSQRGGVTSYSASGLYP